MDKEQIVRIAGEFAMAVARELKVKKVYLYGSYADDTAGTGSDIDIAVVVDHLEGDFLDTEAMLYRTRRSIDARIEPVLINEQNDDSGFLEDIRKHGVPVYGN
ncbi:MAG: nucleotidyltransferase domain-containing protein [Spirochaetales bacterium]|nr:nucleotidyltransferase domain-containing protein [Spirochaetales bacterium]